MKVLITCNNLDEPENPVLSERSLDTKGSHMPFTWTIQNEQNPQETEIRVVPARPRRGEYI